MNGTTMLIMGIAVAFNLIVIKYKIEKERYSDALLDALVLVTLSFVFAGTISGLMVGTVASAIVSIYLMMFPPKEFFGFLFNKSEPDALQTSNQSIKQSIKSKLKPKKTRKIRNT